MRSAYKNLRKHYFFYLGGDQSYVLWKEGIRSVVGGFIGLMLVFATASSLVRWTVLMGGI